MLYTTIKYYIIYLKKEHAISFSFNANLPSKLAIFIDILFCVYSTSMLLYEIVYDILPAPINISKSNYEKES